MVNYISIYAYILYIYMHYLARLDLLGFEHYTLYYIDR